MSKALKVMVSMPDELLEVAIDAALMRGRAALAKAGSFEAAEQIRAERDARDARDRRR